MNERDAIRQLLRERPELCEYLAKAVAEGKLKSTDDLPGTEEEVYFVVGPDHGGIEGSKQVQCACGNLGWLSPSTQEVITRRGAAPMRIMCLRCAITVGT